MLVTAKARLRYVSIPPRKMRLVADMVKGMPVEDALNILNFTPKIAAHHVAKTLKSAAANALSTEGTDHLRPEDLVIKDIRVDEAPTAKRIRFQSMGRVFRIRKRYCHLTVNLEADIESAHEAKHRAGKSKKVEAGPEETAEGGKKTKTKSARTKKAVTKKSAAKETAAGKTEIDASDAATAEVKTKASPEDEKNQVQPKGEPSAEKPASNADDAEEKA